MAEIFNLDDYRETQFGSAFAINTFLLNISASNLNRISEKESELIELINDIRPAVDRYFDHLHTITDIDQMINLLQNAFVFLNKETPTS